MPQHPQRRRFGRLLLPLAAVISFVCLVAFLMPRTTSDLAYQRIDMTDVHDDPHSTDDINPDYAGWLRVENTAIDYPAVYERPSDPQGFYLNHDFWRRPSEAGCPYLQQGVAADSDHVMVFGHHLGLTGGMFTELHDAFDQKRFETLGTLRWRPKDGAERSFRPFCAMRVDKTYERIQRYRFDRQEDIASWLQTLAEEASAKQASWREMAAQARQVMTLITCTDTRRGGRNRTLVVFVR